MKLRSNVLRGKKVFFTSDEHYGHKNIIKFCNRPYDSVDEMNQDIIDKFNSVVPSNGLTIHAGDFLLGKSVKSQDIISSLAGRHIFIKGSHDKWSDGASHHEIIELTIDKQPIIICHYAMRVWARSHYNSWHLYGHSHGGLPPEGKSWDIGVDSNDFYPLSYDDIKTIMKDRPDNFNLVKPRRY